MATATITKVGNSMAVILPKALRQVAAMEDNSPVHIESPRKGVIIITAIDSQESSRLDRLRAAEKRLRARSATLPPWPAGATADQIISQGKQRRSHELLSL